jgi:hypothetical protein
MILINVPARSLPGGALEYTLWGDSKMCPKECGNAPLPDLFADMPSFCEEYRVLWHCDLRIEELAIMATNNQIDELDFHMECKNQCRSSFIKRCIELSPEGLAKCGRYGSLPLHVILMNRSSFAELAFYMIDKYTAALQHRDGYERLPLHLACMSQCRSSIIAKCIELYPESLCTVDDGGYLPLHRLLSNRSC